MAWNGDARAIVFEATLDQQRRFFGRPHSGLGASETVGHRGIDVAGQDDVDGNSVGLELRSQRFSIYLQRRLAGAISRRSG